MDHGPVAGGDHGHLADGEVLVELVDGGGGSAPAGGDHGGGGLELQGALGGVEEPVQGAGDLSRGGGEVDRGAHHQAVAVPHPLCGGVDRVVTDAAAQLGAGPAAPAAGGVPLAQPEQLGLHSLALQGGGHLRQSGVGAALLVGRAVEKQYFHKRYLLR